MQDFMLVSDVLVWGLGFLAGFFAGKIYEQIKRARET